MYAFSVFNLQGAIGHSLRSGSEINRKNSVVTLKVYF